jgi:hypothetical protein
MEPNLTDFDFYIDPLKILDQLETEYGNNFMNENLL